jgi:hypothetical protein
MSSEAIAVKPCPFCGEEKIFLNDPSPVYRYGCINCPACLVVMPGACSDKQELISCWNERVSFVEAIKTKEEQGR